jgi:hypothetical protein
MGTLSEAHNQEGEGHWLLLHHQHLSAGMPRINRSDARRQKRLSDLMNKLPLTTLSTLLALLPFS